MSTSKDAPAVAETSGVELVCAKDEGNAYRSRNTWSNAPMKTGRRASKMILGIETFVIDAGAEWRVKWAQRGVLTFGFLGILFYVLGRSTRLDGFNVSAIVCGGIAFLSFAVLLYKNVSFVMMRRLLKEPNVIIIIVLSLCNWAMEIGRPTDALAPIFGFIYALCINGFVLMDTVMLKSRYLMLVFGVVFVALNIYNVYKTTLGDMENGVILVEYNIEGKEYTIMKRSTKRSIFLQVMLFSANGIYTIIVDKSMKLMVFATGNIYKSTGKGLEEVDFNHGVITSVLRSKIILGKETFVVDAGTEWRVKWAQRGIITFFFFAILCFILGRSTRFDSFYVSAIVCTGITFVCFVSLLYKNISFVMMKRLLKEPNVIIIVMLTVFNWAIEIGRPTDALSSIFGFMYALCVNAFVLIDAVMLKSRYFMIGCGFVFAVLSINNLYRRTLGNDDNGIVLVEYSIEGKEYTIMKRSTQRSIFLQVLLFSANGIYTMIVDKSMKLMVFATGNIYKSTGTASELIEAGSFGVKVKREFTRRKPMEVI